MKVFAKDMMQKVVKTVRPELPLEKLLRRFADENVSGFPVVDEHEGICGVVAISDLLPHLSDQPKTPEVPMDFYAVDDRPGTASATERLGIAGDKEPAAHLHVRDVMNRNVISVTPDCSLHDVAALMSDNEIHRVLVIEKDRLVGLISTVDVVRACGQDMVDVSFTAPKILDF